MDDISHDVDEDKYLNSYCLDRLTEEKKSWTLDINFKIKTNFIWYTKRRRKVTTIKTNKMNWILEDIGTFTTLFSCVNYILIRDVRINTNWEIKKRIEINVNSWEEEKCE